MSELLVLMLFGNVQKTVPTIFLKHKTLYPPSHISDRKWSPLHFQRVSFYRLLFQRLPRIIALLEYLIE